MGLPISFQAWLSALVLLTALSSVAVNCQSESGSGYNSCVCNDPNFQTYVTECIACEGTDSDPFKFQQNCKSVPPDCTVACQSFGVILQDCGDTSAPDFGSCVCAGAYDQTYTNTFNQDFQDCVACENGGGQAADWEAYCCVLTHNCNGMSPKATSETATVQVSPTTTTPVPAPSPTQPNSVSTTTPSNDAAGHRAVNALGFGLGQMAINALIATF